MNTFLKIVSLVLAAGIPVAFSAESNGIDLPAVLGTGVLFAAFVVTLIVLTMVADYRRKTLVGSATIERLANRRSALRLAA